MALCPVWVKKTVKEKRGVGADQQIVPKEKVVICGCKPEVYLRVFYSELHTYRQKEGKFNDLFGVCIEHGDKLQHAKSWGTGKHDWHKGALSGLRGLVERVEIVTMSEGDLRAMAKEDDNRRVMAAFKSTIKRQMGQRNAEKLTVDHWRQVFEECIEEFVAESVMDS